jgi:microcystin-dependent protein
MSEPFVGELRLMAFNFAPKGWAFCNGQLLPISQLQALFSLLGTMYGGDGRVNFGLPNLQGRSPLHVGPGFVQGQRGGEVAHTLVAAEMPRHQHRVSASDQPGNLPAPAGDEVLASPLNQTYRSPDAAAAALTPTTVATVGGSQPHPNQQPYLVLTYCIALQGIFPSH